METLQEIEEAVGSLDDDRLTKFREWFVSFDSARWDSQIERDSAAGKFDEIAAQAVREFEAGQTKEL